MRVIECGRELRLEVRTKDDRHEEARSRKKNAAFKRSAVVRGESQGWRGKRRGAAARVLAQKVTDVRRGWRRVDDGVAVCLSKAT